MIKANLKPLLIGAAVGLVLGILLGMPIFWGLWPVEWTNANTYDLSPEAKAAYVQLVTDATKVDRDYTRAAALLGDWTAEEKQQAFTDAASAYRNSALGDKAQAVEDLGMVLQVASPETTEAPEPPAGLIARLREPCLVFVLVLLALVLAALGWRLLSKRRQARAEGSLEETFRPVRPKPEAEAAEPVSAVPVAQHWVTTYRAGEAAYDESFPIEVDNGEYLGECGVGISEMLGAPDRVTALEVWLFDKSDIRTVTKVLLSEHAYRDEALRAKLSAKGETMLAEVSKPFVLETANLLIEGQITDLAYDTQSDLPKGIISKLTIELDMKPKETAGAAEAQV
ncbi:MAG TPA: hypothetical protein PKO09_08645 [Anaerolineae bacterium]|nr:hypothetical protein [Anaerolineae bacterium]